MPKHVPDDHWDALAKRMRSYTKELTDQRLAALYQKLYGEGWAEPEPMPLSTRDAAEHLKSLMMQAVAHEQLSREGRWFDKLNHPDSGTRRLADAYQG